MGKEITYLKNTQTKQNKNEKRKGKKERKKERKKRVISRIRTPHLRSTRVLLSTTLPNDVRSISFKDSY